MTERRVSKNIFRRIILMGFGIILGINLYLSNASSLIGNKMPMPFGIGMAVVLSGSMDPNLKVDDLIIVKEAEEYNIDDIVVYQSKKELIVHRIIATDGQMITTQGDANNVADEPIDISAVKGVVIARIPYVGFFINILKTPVGIVLVLTLSFLLIEISFRKEKDEKDEALEAIKEEIRRLKEETYKE